MDLLLPDPITSYNRELFRRRTERRAEFIRGHHPGFNLIYWQRIIRAPGRVERWGRRFGWSHDQVMLTKALLISRMACVFIDHIIRRMKEAELIAPAPGAPHAEWEEQYRHFLLLFLRQEDIPDRREIVKLMQRLHNYTVPPESILTFRRRHWQCIRRSIAPLLTASGSSRLLIRRELATRRNPALAARRICFTATLFSDIQERLYHQQWMFAYSNCMLRLYDQLRKSPGILSAIIDLR